VARRDALAALSIHITHLCVGRDSITVNVTPYIPGCVVRQKQACSDQRWGLFTAGEVRHRKH